MILKIHDEHAVAVAEILIKEANLTYANELKAEMIVLVDRHPRNILVDFKQVQYVDSSFLGALVSSLKYAVASKADISVINLAKDIHGLFTLIRLDKVFKIYASKADAIADLNKNR